MGTPRTYILVGEFKAPFVNQHMLNQSLFHPRVDESSSVSFLAHEISFFGYKTFAVTAPPTNLSFASFTYPSEALAKDVRANIG